MSRPLVADADDAVDRLGPLWERLRGAGVFVTGGSGFFGGWMLECLLRADERLDLGTTLTLLTRDAGRFRDRMPQVAGHPKVKFIEGDIRSTALSTPADYVLHMAAEPHGPGYAADPAGKTEVIVEGTRRVLSLAREAGAKRMLLVSSGAVYGPQPDHPRIPEDAPPTVEPDASRRAYVEGKRAAERDAIASGLPVVIARPFAFLGPRLPLEAGFAAGRFLAAAMQRRSLRVMHGAAVRSYLYSSDLAVWLWTILLKGAPGRVYNVGSEQPVTLTALALMIASMFRPPPDVERAAEVHGGHRYVPSTERARGELGLTESVPLPEAVRRFVHWHREVAVAPLGR